MAARCVRGGLREVGRNATKSAAGASRAEWSESESERSRGREKPRVTRCCMEMGVFDTAYRRHHWSGDSSL